MGLGRLLCFHVFVHNDVAGSHIKHTQNEKKMKKKEKKETFKRKRH